MFQGITVPSFSESDGSRRLLDAEGDGTVIIQNICNYSPSDTAFIPEDFNRHVLIH